MNLRNDPKGPVQLRVDLQALAQDLAWKAYYNKRKRATLKNGIVQMEIHDTGVAAAKKSEE